MIFQEDELKGKKIYEIRALMAQYGAGFKRTEKKAELIKRLIELKLTSQPNDKKGLEKEEIKKPELPWLTKEQVIEAVMPFKLQGLKVSFSPDGTCWMFQFDCGMVLDRTLNTHVPKVLTDSGTMKQSINVIKRCAQMLVRPDAKKADDEQERLRKQAAVSAWA